MKILLFSLVLLFSCAHISYGMKIKGGSDGRMYPGGSQGYNKANCRNRGGTCLDSMCYSCDTLPSPPQYKLPVETGPFPKVPADADAKAAADKAAADAKAAVASWGALTKAATDKAVADAKSFNDAMASWSRRILQNTSKS
jgi:hypothetical protein